MSSKMEIERIRPDPENSNTGAIWSSMFIDCDSPKIKLEEFKNQIYQEIQDDIEDYNFDGFMWRAKPDYITENDFETKLKITKFRARVNYFRKENEIPPIKYFSKFTDYNEIKNEY